MTALVAIDLGTKMGWAALDETGQVTSGTESFHPRRHEGGGMRYLRFKQFLTRLKEGCGGEIEAVYFEEVRGHRGTDAAQIYGGFLSTLTMWCEHHRIPYSGIPVGTIKKHATGHGNAKKKAMIQAMRAKGYRPEDDNEADALALLEVVRGEHTA